MGSTPRFKRSKYAGFGSREFFGALTELRADRQYALSAPETTSPAPVELGTCVASAEDGYVNVLVDSSDTTVRAKLDGFMPEFTLEPGDELGVELIDDEWRTIPSVKHVVRHTSRVEWWTVNRHTGAFRLLAEAILEDDRGGT